MLAQHHPLLLVVDDMQWADQPSLDVFSHLVFSLADSSLQESTPLMIIGAHRPGEPTERWTRALDRFHREEHCHTVVLPGLEESEVHELIQHLGARRPTHHLVTTINTATHGNPLCIQEAMHQLVSRGALEQRGGYVSTTVDPPDLHLPEQLLTILAARTQHISDRHKQVLTLAALLGRRWSLHTLRAVSGIPEEDLLDIVTQAVRKRVLVTEGQTFEFAHPLIRHVFAADPIPTRRQRLHWQIAQALITRSASEGERTIGEIALHLIHAGPEAETTLVARYTRRAGEHAFAMTAWGEAARYYEAALAAAESAQGLSPQDRAELHYRAGLAHYRDMDIGPCLDHYERALTAYQLSADVEGAALVLMARTRAYLTQAAVPYGTLVDLEPLQEIWQTLGDHQSLLRGQILATMAEAYWTARQTARAQTLAEQAVEIGRSLPDAGLCALASHVLALTYTQRAQPREALEHWRHALDFAQHAQDPWLQLWPLTRIPWMLLSLGRVQEAETTAEEACTVARKLHNWAEYSLALATLTGIAVLKGDFAAAERLGQDLMVMVQRSHYPWGSVRALPALACARVLCGAWNEAHQAIATLVEPGCVFTEPGPAFRSVARVYHWLIRARAGEVEEVCTQVKKDAEWETQKTRVEQGAVSRLCALVELSTLLDAPEAAAALYQSLTQVAAQGLVFATEWISLLPRILGVAAAANQWWEQAEGHFQQALAVATQVGARPEYARVCLDYAQMLVSRNQGSDRDRAVTLVEEACLLFAELQMEPFLHEACQLAKHLQAPALFVDRKSVV
jgi:tetratricopeptide (TPR) repeat protein